MLARRPMADNQILTGGAQALAVYIHWPFCKSKCPYCDFNPPVREGVDASAWQRALLAELDYMAARMPGYEITSIFFGGGTPSLMPPELAAALIARCKQHWRARDAIEITLEANPTSVEAEKFRGFRDAGVNRVSLGVQSLRAEELTFLGREHSVGEARHAMELAADLFPRWSFDLIYARPNQTVEAWEEELREALQLAGKHLSLYQLTIEPGTAFYHAYHAKQAFTLPDEDPAAILFERTQELMEEAGLPAYEISNHATPGEASRHNLAYWQGLPYVGIGPGAHGRLAQGGQRIATATLKSPERWLEAVNKNGHGLEVDGALDSTAALEEKLMMGLRLREGITLREGEFALLQQDVIAKLVGLELLEHTGTHLRATPQGWLLLNPLIGELLGDL